MQTFFILSLRVTFDSLQPSRASSPKMTSTRIIQRSRSKNTPALQAKKKADINVFLMNGSEICFFELADLSKSALFIYLFIYLLIYLFIVAFSGVVNQQKVIL